MSAAPVLDASGDDLGGRLSAGAKPGLAAAVSALAGAGAEVSRRLARGLGGESGAFAMAHQTFLAGLASSGAAYLASAAEPAILTLDPRGDVAIAVHPLEETPGLEENLPVGSLFAVFPASRAGATASFLRPGTELLAAGYVLHGPACRLALSLGQGVEMFALDPDAGAFRHRPGEARIPADSREFAINMANYRHWHHPVRLFVDDCLAGQNGPRGHDHDMRWTASLVAEAHRILGRGGVFLAPADHRPGGSRGRLRLIHQAIPVAFLIEQAGGAATEGHHRILGLTPADLDQTTPLVFGSSAKVEMVSDYHLGGPSRLGDAPLFGRRGLYRK